MTELLKINQSLSSLIGTIGYNIQDAGNQVRLDRLKLQLKLLKKVIDLLEKYRTGKFDTKALQKRLDEINRPLIDRSHDSICHDGDYTDMYSIGNHLDQLLRFVYGKKAEKIHAEFDISSVARQLAFMTDAYGNYCIDVEEAKTVKKFIDQLKRIKRRLRGIEGQLKSSFNEVSYGY